MEDRAGVVAGAKAKVLRWWLCAWSVALAGQQLEIRYVANAGVSLRCGERVVLVDSLFRGLAPYDAPSAGDLEAMLAGRAPYGGVRLVVATHRHRDHFDAGLAKSFLTGNPRAVFAGTSQTVSEVGAGPRVRLATESLSFDGGSVKLKVVPHNAPAGKSIENAVVDLKFCGQRLVFSGDAEVAGEWFQALEGPDWAFVPWWFLTGETGRNVIDHILKPTRVYALHWDPTSLQRMKGAVKLNYPKAVIGERETGGASRR